MGLPCCIASSIFMGQRYTYLFKQIAFEQVFFYSKGTN
jgi:hypothetical protein